MHAIGFVYTCPIFAEYAIGFKKTIEFLWISVRFDADFDRLRTIFFKCPACNARQEPCGDRTSLPRKFGRLVQSCVGVDHPRMTFTIHDKAYEAVALYPSYILIPCSGMCPRCYPRTLFTDSSKTVMFRRIGIVACRPEQCLPIKAVRP